MGDNRTTITEIPVRGPGQGNPGQGNPGQGDPKQNPGGELDPNDDDKE